MKRLCIFAHYDKDNLIDDYVIYYLRELKKSFNKIIFVSDSDLSKNETDKIIDIVDYIQAFNHGEYDWGSYKYGYFIAKENFLLQGIDEVLFCNASVYGPIISLEPILNKMSNDPCDFWGMFENQDGIKKDSKEPHLQSWFLLLKKNVVDSDLFDDFICSVKHLEDKNEIIQKYEIGFTQAMTCCFKYKGLYTSDRGNVVNVATPKLLEKGFPFIKTVVTRKYNMPFKLVPKELVKLIKKHSKRIGMVPPIQRFFKTLTWKRKMRKFSITKVI